MVVSEHPLWEFQVIKLSSHLHSSLSVSIDEPVKIFFPENILISPEQRRSVASSIYSPSRPFADFDTASNHTQGKTRYRRKL